MHAPIGQLWPPQAETEEKETKSKRDKRPTHKFKVNIKEVMIKKQQTIYFKKDDGTNDEKTNGSNNAQKPFECDQGKLLLPRTM